MNEFKLRVYFSDTDCEGIVYHGKYLDFAEHARSELIRDKIDHKQLIDNHIGFVVKEINIVYEKPGFLNDLLTVETKVVARKRFSITFVQDVKRDDELLCSLTVKVGCTDLKNKKILPIPEVMNQF